MTVLKITVENSEPVFLKQHRREHFLGVYGRHILPLTAQETEAQVEG